MLVDVMVVLKVVVLVIMVMVVCVGFRLNSRVVKVRLCLIDFVIFMRKVF